MFVIHNNFLAERHVNFFYLSCLWRHVYYIRVQNSLSIEIFVFISSSIKIKNTIPLQL